MTFQIFTLDRNAQIVFVSEYALSPCLKSACFFYQLEVALNLHIVCELVS